jgi:hypothetical protein
MDPPAVVAANELLKLGGAGAIIIFLGLTVIILWRKLESKDAIIAALHESRLSDVRKCTEALVSMTKAMETEAEAMNDLREKLQVLISEYQTRRTR